jgi:hypothetical protein
MDTHERAAVSARIAKIEQALADLSNAGLSPAERAKRRLALQGEWFELARRLTPANQHAHGVESQRPVAATGF